MPFGDAVVYSLERKAFEPLVEQHPRLVYHIMRAITRTAQTALLGMNHQVEELTNYIVRQHGRY
jgi:CRP-like cAMP-binding protein